MKQSKFSFAAVFSLMVLLGFSYIAFMGLVYWREGDILMPALLTGGFIVLIIVCLTIMCKSKATRWKRIGTIGQVIFGLIILAAFGVSSLPFTNFMDVVAKQDKFYDGIDEMLESAQQMDEEYESYVKDRLAKYKTNLEIVAVGYGSGNVADTTYQNKVGNTNGSNDPAKIKHLVNNLKREIMPAKLDKAKEERQEWLENASDMSVWNVLLPKNLADIDENVTNWAEKYRETSDKIMDGEDPNTQPFEGENFSSDMSSLTRMYTKLDAPSPLSIVIALVCFLVMLLPYFMTQGDVAGARSKGKNIYE